MTLLQWTPGLEVGVALIDDQHERLVGLLNEMYRLVTRGESSEVVLQIFEELELYTLSHFADEEALMAGCDFEFLATHQDEHRDLARQVVEYRDGFAIGEVDAREVLELLKRWLLTHIAGSDSLIGDHLRRRGLVEVAI